MIWLKDGQRVIRAEEGSQHGGSRLTVPSVQREDQGMYQCVASSDGDSVQAVAELRLGGEYRLHCRNSFTKGVNPYCAGAYTEFCATRTDNSVTRDYLMITIRICDKHYILICC
jgi:hypothetical protein